MFPWCGGHPKTVYGTEFLYLSDISSLDLFFSLTSFQFLMTLKALTGYCQKARKRLFCRLSLHMVCLSFLLRETWAMRSFCINFTGVVLCLTSQGTCPLLMSLMEMPLSSTQRKLNLLGELMNCCHLSYKALETKISRHFTHETTFH